MGALPPLLSRAKIYSQVACRTLTTYFLARLCSWYLLLASIFLIVPVVSSAHVNPHKHQYDWRIKEIAAAATISDQKVFDQRSGMIQSEPAQGHVDKRIPHDSDDEPMVYETPQDYATWARQERDRLIAEGADPDSVILQSEVRNHIPRREDESSDDYMKRYIETMNAMIGRGVSILNDQCTADVVASGFGTADGRFFDLGPGSGATKAEFREFSQWFSKMTEAGQMDEVPQRWRKFEKPEPKRDLTSL